MVIFDFHSLANIGRITRWSWMCFQMAHRTNLYLEILRTVQAILRVAVTQLLFFECPVPDLNGSCSLLLQNAQYPCKWQFSVTFGEYHKVVMDVFPDDLQGQPFHGNIKNGAHMESMLRLEVTLPLLFASVLTQCPYECWPLVCHLWFPGLVFFCMPPCFLNPELDECFLAARTHIKNDGKICSTRNKCEKSRIQD